MKASSIPHAQTQLLGLGGERDGRDVGRGVGGGRDGWDVGGSGGTRAGKVTTSTRNRGSAVGVS